MRAELLPLLEARFNPAIVDVLADEAELAREEWTWMEDQIAASGLAPRPDDDEPGAMVLAIPELERAPLALARLAIWQAMTTAAGGRPCRFVTWRTLFSSSKRHAPMRRGTGAPIECLIDQSTRPAIAWNALARGSS